MSNKDNEYKGSTFWQLILVIPGTILAFTLLISLIAKMAGGAAPEAAAPAAAVAAVEENIKPVAAVEVAAADAGPHVDKSGEEVVTAVCGMCHGTGLMNSPKIGDKDAWKPRIALGYDTLVKNAINGIRTMPAKGGNPALTDGEIANAVAHMANLGGADFKAPAPKAADATASEVTPVADAAVAAPAVVEAAPAAAVAAAATVATTKVMPVEKVAKKVEAKAAEKAPAVVQAPVVEKAAVVEAKVEPVAVAAAPDSAATGKEVYKATCAMCHGTGLMNAPKFGDKEQWAPRITQGYDTLVSHAVNGIRTMPPKGGNEDWSDKEIGNAVKYMANEAGAGF